MVCQGLLVGQALLLLYLEGLEEMECQQLIALTDLPGEEVEEEQSHHHQEAEVDLQVARV